MQGRLQGKRIHGRFFLDEVVAGGSEGCNYLLAVDVDMNTVDGYAMSSWYSGYGDFVMVPGLLARCAGCRGSPARRWSSPIWHWSTAAVTWPPRPGRSCAGSSTGWPRTG